MNSILPAPCRIDSPILGQTKTEVWSTSNLHYLWWRLHIKLTACEFRKDLFGGLILIWITNTKLSLLGVSAAENLSCLRNQKRMVSSARDIFHWIRKLDFCWCCNKGRKDFLGIEENAVSSLKFNFVSFLWQMGRSLVFGAIFARGFKLRKLWRSKLIMILNFDIF